jgi:hypothetical protein
MGVLTVNDSWSSYCNRHSSSDELLLYSYLLNCIDVESPSQLIERFRRLFIEGMEDSPTQVWRALERIVSADFAESEFKYILNRSCYILINKWENHTRLKEAIPQLIALFETPRGKPACSQTSQRLRQLVQHFKQTEQYRVLRLRYLACEANCNAEAQPLWNFIHQYPYLYEHCLLTIDSTDEERQNVRAKREQVQQDFDTNLVKYITYQQLPKNSRSVQNPTLLSDTQLNTAIEHFRGKVDGYRTYRDSAEWFRTASRWTPCYRTFKKELYDYLISSIDSKYGNNHFRQRLYQQLQSTLSHNDSQRLRDELVVKTCRKLLDFLVVENSRHPNHYIFSDLSTNLGITHTIGLLLKIVLLCRPVKSYLEQKFSILFNHYEALTTDKVKWLVESLENLKVAFSIHFGTMKLC